MALPCIINLQGKIEELFWKERNENIVQGPLDANAKIVYIATGRIKLLQTDRMAGRVVDIIIPYTKQCIEAEILQFPIAAMPGHWLVIASGCILI